MIDPPEPKKIGDRTPTSSALAKDWGINVGTNIVVDAAEHAERGASVRRDLPAAPDHGELRPGHDGVSASRGRSTPIEGGTNGRFAQKILETSPRSWAESDVKGLYETGKPEQ